MTLPTHPRTPSNSRLRNLALAHLRNHGILGTDARIDHHCAVSPGPNGAYVQVWVWVKPTAPVRKSKR